MSNISRLIKASTWLTLANVVSKLASAVTLPLLARLLGPAALGVYSIVFATAQAGQTLSTMGADMVMHRNGAQYKVIGPEGTGRLFGVGMSIMCLASLLLGSAVWLFRAPLATRWLGSPGLSAWLGAAAILIVVQPLGSIPLTFLASLQEFRAYAFRSALGIVFGSVIIVFLAWTRGIKGAVVGMLIAAVAQIAWSIVIVRPPLASRAIRLRFDSFWSETRDILRLGFPYYYGNTLLGGLVGLPMLGLVGRYAGLGELGFLRVAQSMAAIVGFIPAAIAPAALSYLAASLVDHSSSFDRLRIVHLRSVWTILLILTGSSTLLLPWIIRLLFGSTYSGAYWLVWLSLWFSVLAGIVSMLIQYLLVSGRTIRIAWVSTMGNATFLGLSILLIPRYHASGYLLSQLAGQALILPFVFPPALKEIGHAERKLIRNLVLATILLTVWTLLLPWLDLGSLSMFVSAGFTIAALATFLYLKVLSPAERVSLIKMVTFRATYA